MTRFRPGDLAQVVPGGQLYGADLEPGDVVEIERPADVDGDVWVTAALGEPLRHLPPCGNGTWMVNADALRLVPTDEQGDDPDTSPLDALIEAATALIRAVLANRVSIEQEWQETNQHHLPHRRHTRGEVMSLHPLRWNWNVDPARWDEVRQGWLAFLATFDPESAS